MKDSDNWSNLLHRTNTTLDPHTLSVLSALSNLNSRFNIESICLRFNMLDYFLLINVMFYGFPVILMWFTYIARIWIRLSIMFTDSLEVTYSKVKWSRLMEPASLLISVLFLQLYNLSILFLLLVRILDHP